MGSQCWNPVIGWRCFSRCQERDYARLQLTCSRWLECLPLILHCVDWADGILSRDIKHCVSHQLSSTCQRNWAVAAVLGMLSMGHVLIPPERLMVVVKVVGGWRLVSLSFTPWRLLTSVLGCSSWTLLMVVRVLDETQGGECANLMSYS